MSFCISIVTVFSHFSFSFFIFFIFSCIFLILQFCLLMVTLSVFILEFTKMVSVTIFSTICFFIETRSASFFCKNSLSESDGRGLFFSFFHFVLL